MQKVSVSQEASNKKQNQCMPKKRDILMPKENSLSLSFYHFYWMDLFLSAADR